MSEIQFEMKKKEFFVCSRKCEAAMFPFSFLSAKEFINLNTPNIIVPCSKCYRECRRNDRIECTSCLKWIHLECTKVSIDDFQKITEYDNFFCCIKCELKVHPFYNSKYLCSESTIAIKPNPEKICILSQTDEGTEDVPLDFCKYIDPENLTDIFLNSADDFRDLTIFHGNVGSLTKNISRLEELFLDCSKLPDIMGVTETRLKKSGTSKRTHIDGYVFISCPTPTEAGGAGIYVSKSLDYTERNDIAIQLNGTEEVWIELKTNIRSSDQFNHIVIGIIYRHPSSRTIEFKNKLCAIIDGFNKSKTKFIIMGDININLSKYNVVGSITDYLNTIQGAGCLSFIDKPTRIYKRGSRWEQSCPDHVYSNIDQNDVDTCIIRSSLSDHFSTISKIRNVKIVNQSKIAIYKRKNTLTDSEKVKFRNGLTNALNDDRSLENVSCVHTKTKKIIETYQKLIDKYMPLRKLTRKQKSFFLKPWLSPAIQVSIRNRELLHKKSLKLKTDSAVREFKTYANKLEKIKKNAFYNYYKQKIPLQSQDKKKIWKSLSEITNHKKKINSDIKRLKHEGGDLTSQSEIANGLNNYFNSIGHEMAKKIPLYSLINTDPSRLIKNSPAHSIYLFKTTSQEIKRMIEGLKTAKAPGIDGITNYILKETVDIIAPILSDLFNKCLSQGVFPDPLKVAKIVPLHKGGAKDDATNYRPISLLPQFGKLLEKIIKKRMVKYFDKHKLITPYQFGFRKGFSTEQAVIEIKSLLLKNLDKKIHTCTIFLDLAKAFDSVDHKILLRKLERYGIRGIPLQLIKSYLAGRQHLVKVGTNESDFKILDIGVPQGSVLGPLLFLLFINDLPNCSKFKFLLFADDTCLSLESKNFFKLQKEVNRELKKVSRWLALNKLSLNISKTKFMIVKRHTKGNMENIKLKLNGKNIERCSSYKYLGVYVDEKLDWKTHVKYICEKVGRVSGMLARLRHCVDIHLLKEVYFALVSSHLSYCNIAWGDANKTTLKPLVKLQNKIIKIISFSPFGTNDTDYLFTNLKLLNLDQIHTLEKAKFIYKHQNKKLPSNFDNYFKNIADTHTHNLRSVTNGNIAHTYGSTCFGQKLIQNEGAKIWNNIPVQIRSSESLNTFASKYKEYLLNSV